MKKVKWIVMAALLAVSLVGFEASAGCRAAATNPGCNATCSVNPPAGGSSSCTSGPNRADCTGYDASGNLCCGTGCICGSFFLCYVNIGATCC